MQPVMDGLLNESAAMVGEESLIVGDWTYVETVRLPEARPRIVVSAFLAQRRSGAFDAVGQSAGAQPGRGHIVAAGAWKMPPGASSNDFTWKTSWFRVGIAFGG